MFFFVGKYAKEIKTFQQYHFGDVLYQQKVVLVMFRMKIFRLLSLLRKKMVLI